MGATHWRPGRSPWERPDRLLHIFGVHLGSTGCVDCSELLLPLVFAIASVRVLVTHFCNHFWRHSHWRLGNKRSRSLAQLPSGHVIVDQTTSNFLCRTGCAALPASAKLRRRVLPETGPLSLKQPSTPRLDVLFNSPRVGSSSASTLGGEDSLRQHEILKPRELVTMY